MGQIYQISAYRHQKVRDEEHGTRKASHFLMLTGAAIFVLGALVEITRKIKGGL